MFQVAHFFLPYQPNFCLHFSFPCAIFMLPCLPYKFYYPKSTGNPNKLVKRYISRIAFRFFSPGLNQIFRNAFNDLAFLIIVFIFSRLVQADVEIFHNKFLSRIRTGRSVFRIPEVARDPFLFPKNLQSDSGIHEVKGNLGYFLGGKQKEIEINHTPSSGVKIKNEWGYTFAFPIRLYGLDKKYLPFCPCYHFEYFQICYLSDIPKYAVHTLIVIH